MIRRGYKKSAKRQLRTNRDKFGDPYSLDGDRYGRCYDDRSRDGNRDDDHHGRSRSVDNYSIGSRSKSSDRNGDHAYDDDDQYSSSGSGARAEDHSQDGRA